MPNRLTAITFMVTDVALGPTHKITLQPNELFRAKVMRRKLLNTVATALFMAFVVQTASGQVSEPNTTTSTTVIDGAKDPEKIHYAKKVRTLLLHYGPINRQNLAAQLTLSDAAIIEEMLAQEQFNLDAEGQQHTSKLLGLCSRMETMEPVDVAVEYEEQAAELRDLRASRYRSQLSRMSKAGQGVIDRYLAEFVTPGMQVGVSSSLQVAESDPESFSLNMEVMCYMAEFGRPPSWLTDSSGQIEESSGQTQESSGSGLSLSNPQD